MPYWISYKELYDTCKWNFTSSGSIGDCNVWMDPKMTHNPLTFVLNNVEDNIDNLRFSDIVGFNFTLTADPNDKIPRQGWNPDFLETINPKLTLTQGYLQEAELFIL